MESSAEPPRFPPPPPPPPAPAPAVKRRLVSPRLLVGLGFVAAVWAAGLFGGVLGADIAQHRSAPPQRPSTLGIETAAPRSTPLPQLDVEKVANSVGASVVAISATVTEAGVPGEMIGTGVITTADGEIVTNAHVVADADEVAVRLPGESEPRRATVVARNATHDLALLRVGASNLTPATFAGAGDVHLGDQVLTIGYALDLEGDPTVTLGIVSSLDRAVSTPASTLKGLIQTDAAISSGNSGGPLVNAVGQVVGINTLVSATGDGSTANGLGFAISTAELLPEIEALRQGGTASDGFLGVELKRRVDGGSGALVSKVTSGSAAQQAGITAGDVVVAVNGTPIAGQAELAATIRGLAPGTKITVSLVRAGKSIEVAAELGTRPAG